MNANKPASKQMSKDLEISSRFLPILLAFSYNYFMILKCVLKTKPKIEQKLVRTLPKASSLIKPKRKRRKSCVVEQKFSRFSCENPEYKCYTCGSQPRIRYVGRIPEPGSCVYLYCRCREVCATQRRDVFLAWNKKNFPAFDTYRRKKIVDNSDRKHTSVWISQCFNTVST